jgi:hypothetical protein
LKGYHVEKEKIVADKVAKKRAYSKPEIRQIKLSLAELTLGTACDLNNQAVEQAGCPPAAAICNT